MKNKLIAFLTHLLISSGIALVCLAVVYLVWNPAPLYKATGITKIFLLMLAIDITLGPLLTFIVYKKGKKTLKFDLTVIAVLQISALIYGMYNVYSGRPVWVAYNVDRFDLVRANEIDTRKLDEANDDYQSLSVTGIKYVAAVVPQDDIELKNQILFEEMESGIAPSQRPELYIPLAEVSNEILDKSQALTKLDEFNDAVIVQSILAKYPEADAFLPLKANAEDMTVLINKKDDGTVVKIVDLRPWK